MYRNHGRVACLLLIGAAAILPGAARGEDELKKRASWKQPSPAEVQQQVQQWLTAKPADETVKLKVEALWAPGGAELSADELLDRVAATIAVVEPATLAVLELCAQPQPPSVLPALEILQGDALAPFARNNLRLYLARWLAQHERYDEALAQVEDLKPADVVDPAALLFYQCVGHHRFLDKEKCLAAVATLLENKDTLPRRYQTVAMLMEADIAPLKTDSLDEVSRLMDDIERRLGFGHAGTKVRKQEDDVVAKLDKLIEELEKQAQQQQSSGSGGGRQATQPMQDSNPGGGSGPGEVDPKKTGARAGWGNLPPKQRQEALQQIAKGLPAHYREVIEEYFRKLARDGN